MSPEEREAVIAHLSAGWKNVSSPTPAMTLTLEPSFNDYTHCNGYDQLSDDVLEKAFKLSLLEPPSGGLPLKVDGLGSISKRSWIRVPLKDPK
jgi:hypothetical protein